MTPLLLGVCREVTHSPGAGRVNPGCHTNKQLAGRPTGWGGGRPIPPWTKPWPSYQQAIGVLPPVWVGGLPPRWTLCSRHGAHRAGQKPMEQYSGSVHKTLRPSPTPQEPRLGENP